jgi:hypothetical protein
MLAALLASGCAGRAAALPPEAADPPAMRVQLAVPPNAPGDQERFEVALFRLRVRAATVGRGPEGEPLVRVAFAVEPAESRDYRVGADGLTPLDAAAPGAAFADRDDAVVSAAGIVDAHARAIATPAGTIVARGSTGGPGRLELVREPARRSSVVHEHAVPAGVLQRIAVVHPDVPIAPPLLASGGCAPTPLALTADPLRVAWLDCGAGALRVSRLDGATWTTSAAPADLWAGDEEPPSSFDARFVGDETSSWPRSTGAAATGPCSRGRRAAPGPCAPPCRPCAVASRGHRCSPCGAGGRRSRRLARAEPRRRAGRRPSGGAPPLAPRRARRAGDLHGRAARARAPAAWSGDDPLVAVAQPGGLVLFRWDGGEWRRWGERVAEAGPVREIALVAHAGAPLLAWVAADRLWTAERSRSGPWVRTRAPLAEAAVGVHLAGDGRTSVVAWIDPSRAVRARVRGDAGWGAPVPIGAGGASSLDVAVADGHAFAATAAGGAVEVFEIGGAARSLGAPARGARRGPARGRGVRRIGRGPRVGGRVGRPAPGALGRRVARERLSRGAWARGSDRGARSGGHGRRQHVARGERAPCPRRPLRTVEPPARDANDGWGNPT